MKRNFLLYLRRAKLLLLVRPSTSISKFYLVTGRIISRVSRANRSFRQKRGTLRFNFDRNLYFIISIRFHLFDISLKDAFMKINVNYREGNKSIIVEHDSTKRYPTIISIKITREIKKRSQALFQVSSFKFQVGWNSRNFDQARSNEIPIKYSNGQIARDFKTNRQTIRNDILERNVGVNVRRTYHYPFYAF